MTKMQSQLQGAVLERLVPSQFPRCVLEAWPLPVGFPQEAGKSGEGPGLPTCPSVFCGWNRWVFSSLLPAHSSPS